MENSCIPPVCSPIIVCVTLFVREDGLLKLLSCPFSRGVFCFLLAFCMAQLAGGGGVFVFADFPPSLPTPLARLAEGSPNQESASTIVLRAGTIAGSIRITEPMRLVAMNGPVRIGLIPENNNNGDKNVARFELPSRDASRSIRGDTLGALPQNGIARWLNKYVLAKSSGFGVDPAASFPAAPRIPEQPQSILTRPLSVFSAGTTRGGIACVSASVSFGGWLWGQYPLHGGIPPLSNSLQKAIMPLRL